MDVAPTSESWFSASQRKPLAYEGQEQPEETLAAQLSNPRGSALAQRREKRFGKKPSRLKGYHGRSNRNQHRHNPTRMQ